MDQDRKPQLPNAITNDQAFLRLIIERLDQQAAILTDMCDVLCTVKETIEHAKTVQGNFEGEKLAEKLSTKEINRKARIMTNAKL